MKCTPFTFPDGKGSGFVCGRGTRRARCFYCGAEHERLCDFAIAEGKTCDRKLCRAHARPAGKGRDFCPDHDGAKPAPPPSSGPLRIFTGNVHVHRSDLDALDVTILVRASLKAPRLDVLEAHLVRLEEPHRRREGAPARAAREVEGHPRLAAEFTAQADRLAAEAWSTYRRGYLAEMIVSSGRPTPAGWGLDVDMARARGVVEHVEAWTAELPATPQGQGVLFPATSKE